MRRLVIALAVLLLPSLAQAGGRVTLCNTDVDGAGPIPIGLNLRDALAGGGTVTFACKPGTTITVTMTHNVTGDTIVDGGDSVTLKTNSIHAMFLVSGRLQLRNLALSNPFSSIGPVNGPIGIGTGPGLISIDNSQVRGSSTPFQVDTIRIGTSTFEGNHGFSIISARVALIFKSTFANNDAVVLRSPRTQDPARPSVSVIGETTFSHNQMAVWWVGELHVSKSTFTDHDNHGRLGGALRVQGAVVIDHSRFDRNHAVAGGGIWMDAGTLSLRRVVFHENAATSDGGAIGQGETGENSIVSMYGTFEGNTAVRGGAIKLGTPGAQTSLQGGPNTFARNEASLGGAVYSEYGRMQLARAVFTDNKAALEGGAVYAPRRGSPVAAMFANSLLVRNSAPDGSAVSGSALTLINSTIADNKGVAISMKPLSHFSDPGARGEVRLTNALITNNSGGNCAALPSGYVTLHNGHSLQFPGNSCGAGVKVGDPLLDGLFVPGPGSPAFDGGDNLVCGAAPISAKDIYAARRPQGKFCAIGAVEGDIDPRLLSSLFWRSRDRALTNYRSLSSFFRN
jgi:predicted outer membrane repeat protein